MLYIRPVLHVKMDLCLKIRSIGGAVKLSEPTIIKHEIIKHYDLLRLLFIFSDVLDLLLSSLTTPQCMS